MIWMDKSSHDCFRSLMTLSCWTVLSFRCSVKSLSSFPSVSLIDAIVLRRVGDTFKMIEDGVKLSLSFINLLGKRISSSPTN